MKDYDVIKSSKAENRVIIHEVDDKENGRETCKYSTIYGGLSWPMGNSPAYYCILGETYLDNVDHGDLNKQRGSLILFTEQEFWELSIDDFFSKLTDDTFRFYCESIYTNPGEEYSGFEETFRGYSFRKNIRIGSLKRAPFADNFRLGLSLIEDWRKAGTLCLPEDSIVYQQLKTITVADFEDSPETKFYAINGLRFAIAAFEKYPASHYVHHFPRSSYSGPNAWMGK